MSAWWSKVAVAKFGLTDFIAFGGLAMIGYGVWRIDSPVVWMITGVTLFWLACRD